MVIRYKQVSLYTIWLLIINDITIDYYLLFKGSRAMTLFNYGFIALDLLSIISDDAGEYTCRVTSSSGTAQSTAFLKIDGILEIKNNYFVNENSEVLY